MSVETSPQELDPVVEVRGRDYIAQVRDMRGDKEHPPVTLLIRLPTDNNHAEVLLSEDPDLNVADRFNQVELVAHFGQNGGRQIAKLLWPRH